MAMLKYQQLQKVGSGNFSSVHLVRNIETGQTAAMKLMKTHQNIALKQAYFLKNFDHPNIVRLLDFEQDAARGETRIVLEYLPENTLELYEGQQFGLREEQVKCVLFQAALGLTYVHERGIIHRDIKPQNILIDKRKAEIKLIDFGLAVSLEKVATDYVATRWYRAPENLLGTKEYSCLIDVFSLACVVVELYLGNPLFPGADNLDQLYRIFNILGEPTDASWPAGARKYRQLGFKGEGRQKRTEEFGLRSLLKACSEGLVSLLERMLVLNPKKRINARQIVMDGYFADVKTIIPPAIYKRFQKDHLLKKTTSKEAIENAESFINQTRSKLKLQDKEETSQQPSVIMPAQQQGSTNNSVLINMALSPRKTSIQEEQIRQRQHQTRKAMGMHVLSPKQHSINALRPPHQPLPSHQNPNSAQQPSILAFRGFNPIKSNKISVKQTRKQQESHSQHKMSRDNSIESAKSKPKDKLISNSIDLGRKILNSSARVELPTKPQRRTTNQREYKTPEHKDKSIERPSGKVLYYFQGQQQKGHSPLRVVMPARQQIPIQGSLRMEQKEGSFLISDSTRMTRNNSAINLPSVRLPAPDNRSILLPSARQRISHSPGINLTQGRAQPLYGTNNRPFEKLKLITNVGSPQLVRQRNDRSQDHSTINVSGMETAQGSVLRGERTLQFKEKVLVQGNRQLIPANHPHHRPQLIEPQTYKPLPTPSLTKLKQHRSVDPPDATKYAPEREPISLGQFKTLQIDDRRDYREPRISTKKDMNKLAHMLSSPRENNISINLNVSIIDDKPEHSIHSKRPRI